MRVAIAVPNLAPHDAVSNDARGMHRVLQEAGFDCEFFTQTGTSIIGQAVRPYHELSWWLGQSDIVIYHYCTADPIALQNLTELKARIVVKYHNVTPSRFYLGASVDHVRGCRLGRDMLHRLVALPIELYLSDSSFNMQELTDLGVDPNKSVVVPPFNEIEALIGEELEPATRDYITKNSTNVLSVGRLVPNKNFEMVIAAVASINEAQQGKVHLHIVGSHDSRLVNYIDQLKTLIIDLKSQAAVSFHPIVGSRALSSYYRYCDLYVTASLHEGFCVPVVEAMAFGLPVISSSAGALSETCGPAAFYADDVPSMANAIGTILRSDEERYRLAQLSLRQYNMKYTTSLISEAFLNTIQSHLSSSSPVYLNSADANAQDGCAFMPVGFQTFVQTYLQSSSVLKHRVASEDNWKDLALEVVLQGDHDRMSEYLASVQVIAWVSHLSIPRQALHLSLGARLVWYLSSFAKARYNLEDRGSVSDYSIWFSGFASKHKIVKSLLTTREKERLESLEA